MTSRLIKLVVAGLAPGAALFLMGCSAAPGDAPAQPTQQAAPASPTPDMAPPTGAADPVADASPAATGLPLPDRTTANGDPAVNDPMQLMPAPLAGDANRGEEGARNVLLAFARAIEARRFRVAYAMTMPAFRKDHGEAQLAELFDDMGRLTVTVPGGRMEGAAGSSYYSVPTMVTGNDGRTLKGTVVLKRVNDVPGASPYSLNWHVYSIDLAPVG